MKQAENKLEHLRMFVSVAHLYNLFLMLNKITDKQIHNTHQ